MGGFPGVTVAKNLPANAGDAGVRTLGWEDPLEEEMVTHFDILAWKIPWTEELGRLHTVHKGLQREATEATEPTPLSFRMDECNSQQLFSGGEASPASSHHTACNVEDTGFYHRLPQ